MTIDAIAKIGSFDVQADEIAYSEFAFSEEAVGCIVQLLTTAEPCRSRFDHRPAEELATIARSTRFVPFIDPDVAIPAWHRSILVFASQADIHGITLDRTVYLRSPTELGNWPLLVHEFVHVIQFDEQGKTGFLTRYAAQYLKLRLLGYSDNEAYLGLDSEREAREIELVANRYRPSKKPYVVPVRIV